jgi:hypothetical protein
MRASLAVALREYNGRASQWRHFAALREDSAISRDNEPYARTANQRVCTIRAE